MTNSSADVENDCEHLVPSEAPASFGLNEAADHTESLPHRGRRLAIKFTGIALLLFAGVAVWKASSRHTVPLYSHGTDKLLGMWGFSLPSMSAQPTPANTVLPAAPVAAPVASAGGYALKGKGKCTNGAGAIIGENQWFWLYNVVAGADGSAQRCIQWCNEDSTCIGYMTDDLTQSMNSWKCTILQNENVNAAYPIVGVAPEGDTTKPATHYCWAKQSPPAASAAAPPALAGTYCGSETFPQLDPHTPLSGTITFTTPTTFNIDASVPYKLPGGLPTQVSVSCLGQSLTQAGNKLTVSATNCIADSLSQFGVNVPSVTAMYYPGVIIIELAGAAFELRPGAMVNGACQNIVAA